MDKTIMRHEGTIIQLGTMLFWFFFWFLNVVDKFIAEPTFLWVGKDRLTQFENYFSSIGVVDPVIAQAFLLLVTILELIAFVSVAVAVVYYLSGKREKSHMYFFWGTLMGLLIFSFFTLGDQIFGDRVELLEHTIYWVALIASWGAYVYFPRLKR